MAGGTLPSRKGPVSAHDRPTLLFITSRGHSGSTLTEMLIGAHSRVLPLGELKQLGSDRQEACRCGAAHILACPFWSKVEATLRSEDNLSLERLELDHPDPEIFGRHNGALLRAAQRISGATLLIDSSKTLKRLERLDASGCFDLRCIHLIRSPYGVVHSNVRLGRDLREACVNYTVSLMKTRRYLHGREVIELHYERLVAHPEEVLREIMARLGLDFEPGQLEWASQDIHTFAGNTMRVTRDSTIRLDTSWRRGLDWRQKLAVAWWTLPTRFRSSWLYEAHAPYWKGAGYEAWRRHRWYRTRQRCRRFLERHPHLHRLANRAWGPWPRDRNTA
jgi:hypothetical protein